MKTRYTLLLISALLQFGCGKKPADRFVEIRGRSQHLLDLGSGKPTVIFISGFGDHVSSWMKIQNEVAVMTRTFSYDRAGLGESEMLGKNRSLDSLISELSEILEAEKIEPPYIVVGHSYGGHIARYFTHQHPDQVSGLLLIDATVEYMKDEFKSIKTPDEIRRYDSLVEHGRDPNWTEGVKREADYFENSNEQIKTVQFNRDIPTTVITAMNTPESSFDFLKGTNQMKVALHKRWASESPHIRHVFAVKSGHYVQFDEPELVIEELETLFTQSRKN